MWQNLQVAFPLVLDTYEFCSEALKKQLDGPREAARAAADRAAGLEKAAKVPPYLLCWEKPADAVIFTEWLGKWPGLVAAANVDQLPANSL